MSTPTQKHTSSRKRIRRGQLKLKKINLVECPKCKNLLRPHMACSNCGTYKTNQVFKIRIPKKFRKKSGSAKALADKKEKENKERKQKKS